MMMGMKTERLLAIILLLQSRGKMIASELAEIFEVSVRTIYRDIDSLSLAGVPVASCPGREGGFYLMEGYKMEPMLLSTEEAVSLFLGGSVIQQYPRLDSTQAITKALAKIEALLPEEYKSDIRRAKERILFDMSPIWGKGKDTHLETLKNAILSNQKVRITYPSHCQLIPDERVINPYGLVCKGGVWNLIAFCHAQAAFVVFLVDHIKAVETLDETFQPMADFDIRGFWERYAKGIERAFQARIEEEES
jgi:predicted DNA-binding transcriptional regulator YafY